MANWCNNTIVFHGTDINRVQKLFKQLIKQQDETGLGVRPDWRACDNSMYLFSIEDYGDGSYRFETKWTPGINTCYLIGRRFKTSFTIHWDECGNGLYGKGIFHKETPDQMFIHDASCTNFRFDEEKEMYIYKGEEYESEYDFMDDIIDNMTPSIIRKPQLLII